MAGDEDTVAQKFSVSFRDRSKPPHSIKLDFLEKVDAFGVLAALADFHCRVTAGK
jgi:hypothetical protein